VSHSKCPASRPTRKGGGGTETSVGEETKEDRGVKFLEWLPMFVVCTLKLPSCPDARKGKGVFVVGGGH